VEVPAVAPVLTLNPQPQTVKLGTNVTFLAAATGLPAPAFQWQFDGANIPGAINASFTLPFVAATNTGNYSVLATNVAGSVTSSNAALSLLPPAAAHFAAITMNGGRVEISFTGDAYWNYTIETSTNLSAWNVLTNLTSTSGSFNFTETPDANHPQLFYRAVATR
jgi:hypothetical protein